MVNSILMLSQPTHTKSGFREIANLRDFPLREYPVLGFSNWVTRHRKVWPGIAQSLARSCGIVPTWSLQEGRGVSLQRRSSGFINLNQSKFRVLLPIRKGQVGLRYQPLAWPAHTRFSWRMTEIWQRGTNFTVINSWFCVIGHFETWEQRDSAEFWSSARTTQFDRVSSQPSLRIWQSFTLRPNTMSEIGHNYLSVGHQSKALTSNHEHELETSRAKL